MTVKEEVHALIDELADDSPWLREIRESLRLNKALERGMEDIRHGRLYTEEEFMAKVRQLWRRDSSREPQVATVRT
jgi:predicted transcriptional regulator